MIEDHVARARQKIVDDNAKVIREKQQRLEKAQQREAEREAERLDRERLQQEKEEERIFEESLAEKARPIMNEKLETIRRQYGLVVDDINRSGLSSFEIKVSELEKPEIEKGVLKPGGFSVAAYTSSKSKHGTSEKIYDTRDCSGDHDGACNEVTISVVYGGSKSWKKTFTRLSRFGSYTSGAPPDEKGLNRFERNKERYVVPVDILPTDQETVDQLVNALIEDVKYQILAGLEIRKKLLGKPVELTEPYNQANQAAETVTESLYNRPPKTRKNMRWVPVALAGVTLFGALHHYCS